MPRITEAIILAGGLGTRLKETVPNLPKCMAPVAGRPFLFYVINHLRSQGILRFIFSLGYKHEIILEYLAGQYATLDYDYVVEEEPLGTGGAIQFAASRAMTSDLLVVNADTLFNIDLESFSSFHATHGAACSLALKPMRDFDRYGTVLLNPDSSIDSFLEKKQQVQGLINGGVYILNLPAFKQESWPLKFSFEKDFLEAGTAKLYGQVQDVYFIDIGIPADYNRAQVELKHPTLDLKVIDKSWTLFIDRDGVINPEKRDEYVLHVSEFNFNPGVEDAIRDLSQRFGHIIIVSNQRGVGRGLMSEADLLDIHRHMKEELESKGGRIDAIFYCTSKDPKHPDRKPNPGMAFAAKRDFPDIDLSKTIMIGNKASDMLFGRFAGGPHCICQDHGSGTGIPPP